MFEVLVNPPLYSYSIDGICELPLALLKLSTHLKERGNEVEMFDFAPIKHFKGYIGEDTDTGILKLRKRRSLSEEILNYKGQKYPLKEYSLARRTGECVITFGEIRDRYYLGADKAIFMEYLRRRKPDHIWVSSSLTYYYKGTVECIEWCKEVYPDVPVYLGGIYPTLCYEHAVKNTKADYVHQGRCDEWDKCVMDHDVLPNKPPCIVRQLTRGCPNKCKFCAVDYIDGTKVTFVDIDKDIEEIRNFAEKYGCYNIRMWGSNVLIPNKGKSFEEWLDKLIALPYKFKITCPEGFAPELLTVGICKKMKQAGFIEIEIPIESVGMLKYLNKKYDEGVWRRAVGYAIEGGFAPSEVRSAIIPGLPDQDSNELLNNLRAIADLGVTPATNMFTPVPKSYLYESSQKFKETDLEFLSPQLMPSLNSQEEWDKLKDIMDVFEVDSFTKKKEILKRRGTTMEKGKDIIVKMAELLADVAEQNITIIKLLNTLIERIEKK